MHRETRTRYPNGSSELGDSIHDTFPNRFTRPRGLSQPVLASFSPASTHGFESSAKLSSLNCESSVDSLKMRMQTRVAVRDKTPHRFQIVPLRDVSKLNVDQTETHARLNLPSTPKIHSLQSPSGKLGPYSQTRSLNSFSSVHSLENLAKDSSAGLEADSYKASPSDLPLGSDSTPRSTEYYHAPRRVLVEKDLNRDVRPSIVSNIPIVHSTPTRSLHKNAPLRNPSYRGSVKSPQRFEDILNHTPRALHSQAQRSVRPRTFATVENSRPLVAQPHREAVGLENHDFWLSRRRNKSLTIATASSDQALAFCEGPETDAKLKRRHAIYRESSYLPYMDKPRNAWKGDDDVDSEGGNWSSISCSGSPDRAEKQGLLGEVADFAQENASESVKQLDDPFELKALGPSTGLSAAERTLRRLTLREVPSGFHTTRSLRLPRLTRTRDIASNVREEIPYPMIILGLFRDIDQAIHEWSLPL